MRYFAIAFVLLSLPALIHLFRMDKRYRYGGCFLMGLLPFVVHMWQLDAAIVNWAAWPGYAKGIVITLEDTIALAIIMTQRQPRGIPPLMGWLALYILAVALSIAFADVWMSSTFYLFQLLRFAIVMAAVSKIMADQHSLKWLAMGLASSMIYNAVVAIEQKLGGAFRVSGTMGHPNEMGMMVHVVLLPMLGMLLAGLRSRVVMLGAACSLVVIILGQSRAAIGFVGLGVALVLLLSLRRRSTPYKKRMIGFAMAAMVVATPFLLHSLGNRMAQQYEHRSDVEYDERGAFERAAKMMWQDHPMGVGANNYVVVANGQGYSARAGVTWSAGSRSTNVHNTYLLVAAETGWAGLVTYIAMLGAIILAGWRFAFGQRNDPRGDIVLGSTVGVFMMALHSQYEWITVTYNVQYVIAIAVGVISGLIRVRALEREQSRREQARARAGLEPAEGSAIA